jgi:hypothetical protein
MEPICLLFGALLIAVIWWLSTMTWRVYLVTDVEDEVEALKEIIEHEHSNLQE